MVKMNFWEGDAEKVFSLKVYQFEKVAVKEYLGAYGNGVIIDDLWLDQRNPYLIA